MISFNKPPFVGKEIEYIRSAINLLKISGDGEYTKKCSHWLCENTGAPKTLLTTSCTHALEMAALLLNLNPGDEVIMPSYTFVSTANAFVLRGAVPVFVDIRPDTMNIDEMKIEAAITDKTKAIVPVHYAGVSAEMDVIGKLADAYNLAIIEDAAQGLRSFYKGKALGTFGRFGCISFHETKNYSMGEGGALFLKTEEDIAAAEVLREKGTNRSRFFRGEVDKYTWVSMGSSYLPSDINAAYLWAQLEEADNINRNRLSAYHHYLSALAALSDGEKITLPMVPEDCTHNAHMFYIKTRNLKERSDLINHLKEREIQAVFHYVPLHASPAGNKYGRFVGEDVYTTKESERLLRLPMYYGLASEDIDRVVEAIYDFYTK